MPERWQRRCGQNELRELISQRPQKAKKAASEVGDQIAAAASELKSIIFGTLRMSRHRLVYQDTHTNKRSAAIRFAANSTTQVKTAIQQQRIVYLIRSKQRSRE